MIDNYHGIMEKASMIKDYCCCNDVNQCEFEKCDMFSINEFRDKVCMIICEICSQIITEDEKNCRLCPHSPFRKILPKSGLKWMNENELNIEYNECPQCNNGILEKKLEK